jgi:hypothetical protein
METSLLKRFRVFVLSVASLVLMGGAIFAFADPAAAAGQTNQEWFGPYWSYLGNPSGGWHYTGHIHNYNATGLCLDVPGPAFFAQGYEPGDPSGAQVQLWDCEPDNNWNYFANANQQWHQVDNGDGSWSYQVSEGNVAYCLDSLGGHHYNGSPVEVFRCNGGGAQRWTIGWQGQLRSVDSPGFCADAQNWGTGNGTKIQLWWCA